MQSLQHYLSVHANQIRPRVLPKQLVQYQENLAENHAILGDRVLDLYLYRMGNVLDWTEDRTAEATQLRGKLFSNRNLAIVAEEVYPSLLEPGEWQLLSEREKGTFVEAVVAACFFLEGQRLTEQLDDLMEDLIVRLHELTEVEPVKNPISMVLEWLQAHGVASPDKRFQTEAIGVQPALRFQTTVHFGLDGETRRHTGPLCTSKDEARRLAAEHVLTVLGLWDVPLSAPTKTVEPPQPAEIAAETFVRDGTFGTQTLERQQWDSENTLAWFARKSKKDPYQSLFLLRAQLENAIEVAGWVGSLDDHSVSIVTVAYKGDRYWTIGASSQSRNQAKKRAGEEMVSLAPIAAWIRQCLDW